MTEYISRQQAQKLLGCDKDTIVRLLRSGEIESARKENGGWLVSYDSLERFMATNWTIREDNVGKLQKVIAELTAENKYLKKLLEDNGIAYNGAINPVAPPNPDISIIDLAIPPRALRALDINGIHSIDQLKVMTMKDLLALDGVGTKAATAIKTQLAKYGLTLRKY